MTEILRDRNKKFAAAIQSEYEAERIKTQSRYKHLVQERLNVQDMKDAGDKAVQGEAGPKTLKELADEGDSLLADDTSVADERLKAKPANWTYDEIEALVADDVDDQVPFTQRLPYQAIEKLKADPPKTKKFYRAHFAKQMANIIARAEELLGEDAKYLPEVRLGADPAIEPLGFQQLQDDIAPMDVEEEEDELAGLSPAQRAIHESRNNVNSAWNAYRYVRSYTSYSDGLAYYTDDKMYPEKLGPAGSKIEAEDAKARLKKIGNISYKGIIDMPVWKSKRQLREEAAEARANPKPVAPPKPVDDIKSQEAEELVELFMAGKLF